VDFGTVTQTIEQDIINPLKEVIVALKRARQQLEGGRMSSQSCNGGLDAVGNTPTASSSTPRSIPATARWKKKTRKMDDSERRLEVSPLAASARKNG
jgi:hypothetical protein